MDKELSTKISFLSFWLMLMVLMIHCINIDDNISVIGDGVWVLEKVISYNLCGIAVPLFFFISGYLFFVKIDIKLGVTLSVFKEKIGKRIKTLFVPYLFWCTFWYFFLFLTQLIPDFSYLFSSPLHKMSIGNQFLNLFLEPVNYPFWFLRELILYVIITPIFYVAIKHLRLIPILLLFSISIFQKSALNLFNVELFQYWTMFFFALGMYSSMFKINLKNKLKNQYNLILLTCWFSILFLLVYLELYFDVNNIYFAFLKKIYIIIGCFSFWFLYDYLKPTFNLKFKNNYSYSFFIFSTHGIPLLFLKKIFTNLFELTNFQLILLYIFSFVFIYYTMTYLGVLLKKKTPKIYSIICGNR